MENIQQKGIITLIKSALTGIAYKLPDGFNIDNAAKYAAESQTVSIIYYGALNCGIPEDLPSMELLFSQTCCAMALNEQQTYEYRKITAEFQKNQIEYMPLKGILLKEIYPKPDMRSMSDIDILIKPEQYGKIKVLFENMGYTEKSESNHELPWRKNNIYIELHKRIISTYNKDFYQYFGDGWELGKADELQPCKYLMKPEDAFIYLFAHFAKHYRSGGIGIKHMTDLWVYIQAHPSLDNEYIEAQISELKLSEFYNNILLTLKAWFSDADSNIITDFITNVIFESGSYGNWQNHISALMIREQKTTGHNNHTHTRQILKTVFLPYKHMCKKYPFLEKIPLLLPLMWIARGINVAFSAPAKIKRFYSDSKIMADENTDIYHQSLKFVGLDYNYGENDENTDNRR